MNLPEKIYKYRAFDNLEYVKEIFEKNQLYLAKRTDLNDPFEGCNFRIHLGVAGESIPQGAGEQHSSIKEKLEKYRILSLSETCRSPQMWAHYADNYSGFCLQFSTKENFKDLKPVKYISSDTINERKTILEDGEELQKIMIESYHKKGDEWGYEKEYRILRPKKQKYFKFENKELEAIILGVKISEKNKKLLEKYAKENEIKILKMFISNESYKIRILDNDRDVKRDGSNIEDIDLKEFN